MKAKLLALVALVDLRDLHCYGGIALTSLGCCFFGPGPALIVAGSALFYLSLRKA